eukprot:TRINITY_DN2285_c0_g1_i2.p1 TRINITY_DN2285_c0_g1~~TRINITY_DN2285_c0_g1_i2.p1  ORF type:complete len:305 (-),score=44.87 TRINITY_DN2285_c0_g1_i2:1-915(-)
MRRRLSTSLRLVPSSKLLRYHSTQGHTPSHHTVPGVKHIIAVASGKGGVGKSTTSVNLALALAKTIQKPVAILDADIYGPTIPRMLNLMDKRPEVTKDKLLIPLTNYGLQCMSMGFLVEHDSPMIWRGPMVMSAIDQLLYKVKWDETEIMVIDLPPGTGDAQLTLTQRVPLSGAVIVSTPQDVALISARRGVNMFKKVSVPILGIVENMSYFICPCCNESSHIFGKEGARRTAKELDIPFLGEIPLDIQIRETSDTGKPVVISDPNSALAKCYLDLAAQVLDRLKEVSRPVSYTHLTLPTTPYV